MNDTNTLARSLHDLGLGTWLGGTMMGAVGLNGAAEEIRDPAERSRVVNAGWARWTPVNFTAIGAYLVGGAALTWGNKGRLMSQRGVGELSAAKLGITALALGATAYSRVLGQRIMDAGDVPVQSGTSPAPMTPEDVAKAQRQLKILQWAVPAHVAALVVLSARMGEQQRPTQVIAGTLRQLAGARH
jgi:hypothetical protein